MDKEKVEKPLTREDVQKLIDEHGSSEGLDLSRRIFEKGIDLSGLPLSDIILQEARLGYANLRDANLCMANLQNAYLVMAMLQNADLSSADLQNADLSGADLRNVNLHRAKLQNACLFNTNLQSANLWGADLQNADLSSANLKNTNLRSTKLHLVKLGGVILDNTTDLEDVDWGRDYMVGEESQKRFEEAERVYRILERWHENAGFRDLAGKFAFRKKDAQRKLLGADVVSKFREAFHR